MGVVDNVKEFAKLVQKLGDIELLKKMSDLQTEVFSLHDENRTLSDRVATLERKLAFRERLIFEKNSYWLQDGDKTEGPFCTRCYDKDEAARRMIKLESDRIIGCPTCTFALYACGTSISDPSMLNRVRSQLIIIKPK